MYDHVDVSAFLAEQLSLDATTIEPDESLVDDLGVDGDDFDYLMEALAQQFSVDMSGYRWYFHHLGEPSPAVLFFRRHLSRNRIDVTPRTLLEAANAGRWLLEYPPHKGPPRRIHLSILSCGLMFLILFLFPWAIMQLIEGFLKLAHNR